MASSLCQLYILIVIEEHNIIQEINCVCSGIWPCQRSVVFVMFWSGLLWPAVVCVVFRLPVPLRL